MSNLIFAFGIENVFISRSFNLYHLFKLFFRMINYGLGAVHLWRPSKNMISRPPSPLCHKISGLKKFPLFELSQNLRLCSSLNVGRHK